MKVQHIAIIGLGSIGRRHLHNLRAIRPEIDVTLVRSGYGKNWPEQTLASQVVNSVEQAVNAGIQAAVISSPATKHVKQAKVLAEFGVHLLVEKPLSHTMDHIDELLRTVQRTGIIGLTGYALRYDPAIQKFKEMLEGSRIGQLLHARVECGSYLPDWRPEEDYRQTVSASLERGGGVLLELSHELDYIRWFFGEISTIQAYLHNSGTLHIDVEESADLIFTSNKGLPVSVHLDFNRRHPTRCCTVQGTEGELTWDAINKLVTWRPAGGEPQVKSFDFERDFIYREQLKHFLACIENGSPPAVTLEDGSEVVRLVDAARQSHETGNRVALA